MDDAGPGRQVVAFEILFRRRRRCGQPISRKPSRRSMIPLVPRSVPMIARFGRRSHDMRNSRGQERFLR